MLQNVTRQPEDIISLVASHTRVNKKNIFTFLDFTSFLSELLKLSNDWSYLISIGAALPEVGIAADRADLTVKEIFGKNPFVSKIDQFLAQLKDNNQPIYLSNPNRISGGNFSLKDIKKIIEVSPNSLIIIDEYYFDFYGITAGLLAKEYDNIVILRSFTAAFGISSFDTGYAIASEKMMEKIEYLAGKETISETIRKSILATILNEEASRLHLEDIHKEALRVATRLNKLGVQSRIVAGDFLLLRVKNPVSFGNFLTKYKIGIDNLDGYPQMKNYMRYKIQSCLSNDKFLKVINKMPSHYYTMIKKDSSTIRLHHSGEKVVESGNRLNSHTTNEEKKDWIDVGNMNFSKRTIYSE